MACGAERWSRARLPTLERRVGDSDGTFAKGNSGKPKGSRHKATQAALSLLEGCTGQLTSKVIELALDGDTTALRLCLERICPARKDTPVVFDLPTIQNAEEASEAARAILAAVSQGELTPLEAVGVMGLVETFRKTLETSELESRISKLELQK